MLSHNGLKLQNHSDLPNSFVKDLLDVAGHKEKGLELTGAQCRQLLEAMGFDWVPDVEKGALLQESLRNFKAAVREKVGGSRKASFSMEKEITEAAHAGRREFDLLHVEFHPGAYVNDDVIEALLKQSGLSRFFEIDELNGAFGMILRSKKGRKIQ